MLFLADRRIIGVQRREVVGAAEPSMAMTPDGGILALWSSVYRRRGYMFNTWKSILAIMIPKLWCGSHQAGR
jgi:hypothetical protein